MTSHHTGRTARLMMAGSVITAVLVVSAACGASDGKAADTGSPSSALSTPKFTAADFARLRWLVGEWRGRMQDGKAFYESYRVMDDSTLQMGTFSDSTFKTQKDSAVIELRGGVILDQGNGSPWFATRVDTNGVNFESDAAPANHFTWTRVSPDSWTAHIFTTDRSGTELRVVYQLERVKRK